MLEIIGKKDFETEITGIIPLARMEAYAEKRNDAGGRFLCVLLEIKAWGFQKSRRERNLIYLRFRSVADWMKNAYEDHILTNQAQDFLNALSVEGIIQLVWDIAQKAKTPEETVDCLQEYISS